MISIFKGLCLLLALVAIVSASVWARDVPPIQQTASLPPTIPWDLEALSKAPEVEWGGSAKIRPLYYPGEPYQGRATRVFAYYTTPGRLAGDPSLDRDLPAIVLVHGGVGTAFPEWAELWAKRGYAAIAMDLSGRGPEWQKLSDGGPPLADPIIFHTMHRPVTDQWSYQAVANVIRAHSLLLSMPEVDQNRTAITGISWGGYLTCIVAGLDGRFKAAVPVYGCGFLKDNSGWLKEFAKMSDDTRANWTDLWDPSQYVGATTVPMLFVSGGKDLFYPPDSLARTYDLVTSSKNLHFVPDMPHGYFFDKPKAIEVFVNQCVNAGIPLPNIAVPQVTKDSITASCDSVTALKSGALYYTRNPVSGDARKRNWVMQEADLSNNRITSKLPPEGAQMWFLTVTDERDVTVSSEIRYKNERETL